MEKDGGITLSKLIESAAAELRKAKTLPTTDPVMQFSGCEISLDVKVAAEASGGIKIWVLEIGGKASKEKNGTIKLAFGSIPGQLIVAAASTPGAGPAATRDESGK